MTGSDESAFLNHLNYCTLLIWTHLITLMVSKLSIPGKQPRDELLISISCWNPSMKTEGALNIGPDLMEGKYFNTSNEKSIFNGDSKVLIKFHESCQRRPFASLWRQSQPVWVLSVRLLSTPASLEEHIFTARHDIKYESGLFNLPPKHNASSALPFIKNQKKVFKNGSSSLYYTVEMVMHDITSNLMVPGALWVCDAPLFIPSLLFSSSFAMFSFLFWQRCKKTHFLSRFLCHSKHTLTNNNKSHSRKMKAEELWKIPKTFSVA